MTHERTTTRYMFAQSGKEVARNLRNLSRQEAAMSNTGWSLRLRAQHAGCYACPSVEDICVSLSLYNMCIYIYIYILYICMYYMQLHIYIYRERERESNVML